MGCPRSCVPREQCEAGATLGLQEPGAGRGTRTPTMRLCLRFWRPTFCQLNYPGSLGVVRLTGFEPARAFASLAPQASVSANSTTDASVYISASGADTLGICARIRRCSCYSPYAECLDIVATLVPPLRLRKRLLVLANIALEEKRLRKQSGACLLGEPPRIGRSFLPSSSPPWIWSRVLDSNQRSSAHEADEIDQASPTRKYWWTEKDLNLRSPIGRQIYSLVVLAAHPSVHAYLVERDASLELATFCLGNRRSAN